MIIIFLTNNNLANPSAEFRTNLEEGLNTTPDMQDLTCSPLIAPTKSDWLRPQHSWKRHSVLRRYSTHSPCPFVHNIDIQILESIHEGLLGIYKMPNLESGLSILKDALTDKFNYLSFCLCFHL